jgi:porphobilinogen deaminase
MAAERPIIICTRGSALALAQANLIAAEYLQLRQEEVARCEKIIAEKVAVLLEANRYTAK